jgi:Protein of unknown function (DUF3987)
MSDSDSKNAKNAKNAITQKGQSPGTQGRRLKGSWLEHYLKYTSQLESPKNFHFFTGVSILGAALRRNVWVDQFYFKVYPNLYITLVAVSAMCRKSTAAEVGVWGILDKVEGTHIFEAKTSTEGLIDEISNGGTTRFTGSKVVQDSSLLVFASEMSVLFSSASYSSDIIHIFTDAYGGKDPFRYKLKKNDVEVPNFSPSLLCCTTPSLLAKIMTQDATTGGFTGRNIFVVEVDPGPRVAWLRGTEELERLQGDLVADLEHMANLYGEYRFTPEAMDYYQGWYEKLQPSFEDVRFSGYFQRKHIHVLKIATILGIAKSDELVGGVDTIKSAIAVLDSTEKTTQHAFKYVGSPGYALGQDIIEFVERRGGVVRYGEVVKGLRSLAKSNQEFNDIVTGLETGEEIKIKNANGERYMVSGWVTDRKFNGYMLRLRGEKTRKGGNGPGNGSPPEGNGPGEPQI